MRRYILLPFVAIFLFGSALTAQNMTKDPVVKKVIEMGMNDNQAMDLLDELSNRIGGRIVGSDALENAEQWAAAKFREWGLDVIVQEVREMPVGFNRGPWFGKMLSEEGMHLNFVTPSYTAGTKGVQRGHVLKEPKTRAEFDRMKGVLKGAWVLIGGRSTGWPIDYSAVGDSIRAAVIAENEVIDAKNMEIRMHNRTSPQDQKELLPLKEEPALFYKEMVEAGILGIIQSSPIPMTALYDRKNVEKMTWETLPTVPDIKLDERQYKVIEDKVTKREYFQLEFDIRNHFKPGPVKIHNIIGVMKGSKYPNEYVMAGGHLDAFDSATGGVDCGSGSTVTMEAARLLAKSGAKPKRTILFCLWTAEEFGLWGSKFWVENSKELNKISNYFNRDGGPLAASSLTVPPAMYDDFEKVCAPLMDFHPDIPFVLRKRETAPRPRPTSAGGSDHAYFALNGVPTVSFGTSDPYGYNFSYGEIWHTNRDLYNMSIPEYQEYSAITTAVVMYGLAQLDHILSREGLYSN